MRAWGFVEIPQHQDRKTKECPLCSVVFSTKKAAYFNCVVLYWHSPCVRSVLSTWWPSSPIRNTGNCSACACPKKHGKLFGLCMSMQFVGNETKSQSFCGGFCFCEGRTQKSINRLKCPQMGHSFSHMWCILPGKISERFCCAEKPPSQASNKSFSSGPMKGAFQYFNSQSSEEVWHCVLKFYSN